MIMCNWLLLAARTAMIDQCTKPALIPESLPGDKPVAGKLVCKNASSFAFPGVITTVPAAQRTLDFPNAVGHAGHFWHLWHWSGLAGFLYALVAPAPLWAHSVIGTIVQLGAPAAAALVQYCMSCRGCPKSWHSLPLQ